MDIDKSSRYSKIIGNFGEMLICTWLSRSGFEVALVDHTGIDLVAYHMKSKRRLGITVKSRTRRKGYEYDSVNLFTTRDRKKIDDACAAFECEPWIGVYVESASGADLFLTSRENYDAVYCQTKNKLADWKMTQRYLEKYRKDLKVSWVQMKFDTQRWSWEFEKPLT